MEHLLSASSPCSGDIVGKQPQSLPPCCLAGRADNERAVIRKCLFPSTLGRGKVTCETLSEAAMRFTPMRFTPGDLSPCDGALNPASHHPGASLCVWSTYYTQGHSYTHATLPTTPSSGCQHSPFPEVATEAPNGLFSWERQHQDATPDH